MRTSIAARANLELIEENYRRWRQNPESVDSDGRHGGVRTGEALERNGAFKPAEIREGSLQSRTGLFTPTGRWGIRSRAWTRWLTSGGKIRC
jgi:hypothetical protein